MGKHTSMVRRKPLKEADRGPHAIWRGIGCLMILLIPILSIALGYETVQYGIKAEWPIPYQLLGTPKLPDMFYDVRILRQLSLPVRRTEHFFAYATFSIGYMVVIGGLISVVYAFIYRMVGPARYGPFDAPPPKIKTKKYTR